MQRKQVFVESEFAPLKRVVLTQSEFIFPQITQKKLYDDSFLPEESVEEFRVVGGKNFADVNPEKQKQWDSERESLKNILEAYDVEVLRPRKMTSYEKENVDENGMGNFFVRDPFFTIGNIIIEGSLRFFHRRNEIFPVRDILLQEARNPSTVYISAPRPDISSGMDSPKGPFIEGGDVLVYGKTVLVGYSGQASNTEGLIWLESALRPFGYQLVPVPLKKDILHLDCAISLVRDGLAIVCREGLMEDIPSVLKNWDIIEVTKEQSKILKVNGLPVNEKTYITDIAFKDLGENLEKKGIHVEYIDFRISRSLGGSIRCSTQPLLRI